MKKIPLILCSLISSLAFSQVGINTSTPAATLDITSSNNATTPDGILTVRLTEAALRSKNHLYNLPQHSTVVYVTDVDPTDAQNPITGKTEYIKAPGFYYYNAYLEKWLNFNMPKFFYMPSVAITPNMAPQINLYNLYKTQFTTPAVKSESSTGSIPILGPTDLEYYVTSYDTSSFTIQNIDEMGVMTFSANNNTSDVSFMNIIFVVK